MILIPRFVKNSSLDNEGYLTIEFDNGSLIFDMQKDRVILVDGNGIYHSQNGIGNFHNGAFDRVSAKSNKSIVYHADHNAVLWENGFALLNLKAESMSGILDVAGNFGYAIKAGSCSTDSCSWTTPSENGLAISKINFGEITHKKIGELNSLNDGHVIANGNVYTIKNDNLVLLTSKGDKKTSLTSKTQIIFGNSSVLMNRTKGSDCKVVHLRGNDSRPASFNESGLAQSCSSNQVFSPSNDSPTITSLSGKTLKISILNPK